MKLTKTAFGLIVVMLLMLLFNVLTGCGKVELIDPFSESSAKQVSYSIVGSWNVTEATCIGSDKDQFNYWVFTSEGMANQYYQDEVARTYTLLRQAPYIYMGDSIQLLNVVYSCEVNANKARVWVKGGCSNYILTK